MKNALLPHHTSAWSNADEKPDTGSGARILPKTACFEVLWDGPGSSLSQGPVDISPISGLMRCGDRFDVVYRRTPTAEGGRGSVTLELHSTGIERNDALGSLAERSFRGNFKEEAHALFSGFSLVDATPVARGSARSLTPTLHQASYAQSGDPEAFLSTTSPRSIDVEAENTIVVVGAPSGATVDIVRALSALARLKMGFELTVSLHAFELSLPKKISVSRAMRENSLHPNLFFQNPGLARRRIATLETLRRWMVSPSGIRLECSLFLDGAHDPSFSAIISRLLFQSGAADAVGHSVAEGVIDLSMSFPATTPLPKLVPTALELEKLDLISLGPPRAALSSNSWRCLVGETASGKDIGIPDADLARHTVVVGSTGVGKSSLLRQMISQATETGSSAVVIEPHGDLIDDVLASLSPETRSRVVLADVSGSQGRFGLSLLRGGADRGLHANFVCNQLINVFRKVLYRSQPEGFGPMFEAYFRNALMLLMLSDGYEPKLTDFDRVFHDGRFRQDLLSRCSDEAVVRFWRGIALKASGEAALEAISPYVVSKFTQFTGNPLIRPIISDDIEPINFADILDNGQILLVNLSKGTAGESDAALIGALTTIQLFAALLARSTKSSKDRKQVYVFMDEFQTYTTETLAQMLGESRKFGSRMVLATQSLASLDRGWERTGAASAILANVGNLMAFRSGPEDARLLADWFEPEIDPKRLTRLPDRVFAGRLLDRGCPRAPALFRTKDLRD